MNTNTRIKLEAAQRVAFAHDGVYHEPIFKNCGNSAVYQENEIERSAHRWYAVDAGVRALAGQYRPITDYHNQHPVAAIAAHCGGNTMNARYNSAERWLGRAIKAYRIRVMGYESAPEGHPAYSNSNLYPMLVAIMGFTGFNHFAMQHDKVWKDLTIGDWIYSGCNYVNSEHMMSLFVRLGHVSPEVADTVRQRSFFVGDTMQRVSPMAVHAMLSASELFADIEETRNPVFKPSGMSLQGIFFEDGDSETCTGDDDIPVYKCLTYRLASSNGSPLNINLNDWQRSLAQGVYLGGNGNAPFMAWPLKFQERVIRSYHAMYADGKTPKGEDIDRWIKGCESLLTSTGFPTRGLATLGGADYEFLSEARDTILENRDAVTRTICGNLRDALRDVGLSPEDWEETDDALVKYRACIVKVVSELSGSTRFPADVVQSMDNLLNLAHSCVQHGNAQRLYGAGLVYYTPRETKAVVKNGLSMGSINGTLAEIATSLFYMQYARHNGCVVGMEVHKDKIRSYVVRCTRTAEGELNIRGDVVDALPVYYNQKAGIDHRAELNKVRAQCAPMHFQNVFLGSDEKYQKLIWHVYENGPRSCMTGNKFTDSPIRVYCHDDNDYHMAFAYRTNNERLQDIPPVDWTDEQWEDVVVINRALNNGEYFVRAYGANGKGVFNRFGLQHNSHWTDGQELAFIREDYDSIVMPYLDGSVTTVRVENGRVWQDSDGEIDAQETCGYIYIEYSTCDRCSANVASNSTYTVITTEDGDTGEVCESCYDDAVDVYNHDDKALRDICTATDKDGWVLDSEVVTCELTGEDGHEENFHTCDVTGLTVHDDYYSQYHGIIHEDFIDRVINANDREELQARWNEINGEDEE